MQAHFYEWSDMPKQIGGWDNKDENHLQNFYQNSLVMTILHHQYPETIPVNDNGKRSEELKMIYRTTQVAQSVFAKNIENNY